ncbi:hypothetical protein G9A89_004243 [Geosiphon pyriformis]|nr:hypothetical protein G9A89_004243 [Geosiphon pyriformis]
MTVLPNTDPKILNSIVVSAAIYKHSKNCKICPHYGMAISTESGEIWFVHNTQNFGLVIHPGEILKRGNKWTYSPYYSTKSGLRVKDFYEGSKYTKNCWDSVAKMILIGFDKDKID